MRVAVIGASAGVGLACVQVALARGHTVHALARSVASLPQHPALLVHQGSATRVDDLRAATRDTDAILVTLGTGKSTHASGLYTDFATTALALQDEIGARPFIVLTGFGAGDSARWQGLVVRTLFTLMLRDIYAEKTRMEDRLMASRLNWILVRPGVLTDREPARPARVVTTYGPGLRMFSVGRRQVAEFMVGQAEHPTCLHQKPALVAAQG